MLKRSMAISWAVGPGWYETAPLALKEHAFGWNRGGKQIEMLRILGSIIDFTVKMGSAILPHPKTPS